MKDKEINIDYEMGGLTISLIYLFLFTANKYVMKNTAQWEIVFITFIILETAIIWVKKRKNKK